MIKTQLHYRPQGRDSEAWCNRTIYDLAEGRTLMKMREAADNPGLSVTNAAA